MAAALDNRMVVVTGAGSGIGRATAIAVAHAGGRVIALDRSEDGLAETAAGAPGAIESFPADVTDEAAVAAAVRDGAAEGGVHGVVTSAGIFDGPDLAPAHEVSLETFLHVLSVNLAGTFLAIKHALPAMLGREPTAGSIVTIASTAALRGHGFGVGYTASKGGVAAMTRLLAVQYGPRGIRANCICPGGVDTPMTGGVWRTDDARASVARTHPLGRVADPEDIADVAVFLLSDASRHVTGQTLPVDAGVTIT